MNPKFLKWQVKAWLTPIIVLSTILVITSLLRASFATFTPLRGYLSAYNEVNAHFGYLFTGAYIAAIVFGFLSSDHQHKKSRYDAYAQLPAKKNGVRLNRCFLGWALVVGLFTIAFWASTGIMAVRYAYLSKRVADPSSLVAINYLHFLLAYLYSVLSLSSCFAINAALASFGHTAWTSLMAMLFGNVAFASSIPLVILFFIPNGHVALIAPGVPSGYQFLTYLANLSANPSFTLRDTEAFALIFNSVVTVLGGVGALLYLIYRKPMSGEFAGGKRFDSFGKETLPHITALGIAAAVGVLGRQIGADYSIMSPQLGAFMVVLFGLGYLVALAIYFGNLRLRPLHWIIYASICVLTVVFFCIGLATGYPSAA